MSYTPFTSILKFLVQGIDEESSQEIRNLLREVLTVYTHNLHTAPASFTALVSSLKASEPEDLHRQLVFLDNCLSRGEKKPVHYVDLVEALHEGSYGSVSPLVAIITEQWPFVIKNGDAATEAAVGAWIARLLGHFKQAGEHTKALKSARDKLCEAASDKQTRHLLKKSLKVEVQHEGSEDEEPTSKTPTVASSRTHKVDLNAMFGPLPTESETRNELRKWEKEELEVAVEQGSIAELMLCLCSEHEEVRRQAYSNLTRFMGKLKVSYTVSMGFYLNRLTILGIKIR